MLRSMSMLCGLTLDRRRRWACVSSLALLTSLNTRADTPRDAQPTRSPEPQSLAEFLDSLTDNALNGDRSQFYSADGKRRMVRLGGGWTGALDENYQSRALNSGSGPGTAGPPGRALEFVQTGAQSRTQIYTLRDSTGSESGALFATKFGPEWTLRTQALRKRDNDTGIVRRDAEAALRYGADSLWFEALLRHAALDDPRINTPLAGPAPRADFAGLKAQWQPEGAGGLALTARTESAFKQETAPGEERLARPGTELGAEVRIRDGALSGAHVYWREALQLGLLSSDGFEERATYLRRIGLDIPDGSPDGVVYTQLRQRSLLDDRDALLVAGWRHSLVPAPGWNVSTLLEQAQPIGGPNAVRSSTVGLSVAQSAHPHHTASVSTEVVRSSVKDSAYIGADYTQRLTENTLGALRLSITDQEPHDPLLVPVTDAKLAFGWAWREPEARLFNTLWRYTLVGRNAHAPNAVAPGAADRRARILFSHFGWQAEPLTQLSLRTTRRWDRDESFNAGALRTTDQIIVRVIRELGKRWSVSAHVGTLRDSALPIQNGYGAELGLKLSSKVVLAVGYNPRDMSDNELAIDDRLGKGFTIRLRFSIESALARWLDPPWPLTER